MTEASYPDTVICGVPVVATPAEIDITTAGQLDAALLRAGGRGHPVVVVDMTGTRFCDSAGLQALTAASRRVRAEGGELRLVVPTGGSVPRVFALTGIDRYVPCFARLQEALAEPPGQAGSQPVTSALPAAGSDERLGSSL